MSRARKPVGPPRNPEREAWRVAIRSTGLDDRTARELAGIALRRRLTLAGLARVKAVNPGAALFRALDAWIRGTDRAGDLDRN